MQPIGYIRHRSYRPEVPDGYKYPIYINARAPLHDYYDSQGTIMSSIGKFTIDYRPPETFSGVDHVKAGFSEYVLVTEKRIDGPADLRRFEIGNCETPREEVKLALTKDCKPVVKHALPAHQRLAVALGIEPERFDAVDAAWAATKPSDDSDPEDVDEFYDKLDEILDIQDIEENADYDDESAYGDDDVPPSVGFSQEPTVLMTESLADTVVDTTTGEETTITVAPKSGIDPDSGIAEAIKGLQLMGLDPITSADAEGNIALAKDAITDTTASVRQSYSKSKKKRHLPHEEPELDGLHRPGDEPTEVGRNYRTKKGPDKELKGSWLTRKGKIDVDRNPRKVERRKSFEKAASKLAAIPRTRTGEERLSSLSHDKKT